MYKWLWNAITRRGNGEQIIKSITSMLSYFFQASPATSRRGSVNEPSSRSEGKVTVPDQSQQASSKLERTQTLFTEKTQCIVWGMQQRAVQGMLDFDYVCSRREPSVVAMIYPFTWVTFFFFFNLFSFFCVFHIQLNLVLENFLEKYFDKICYSVYFKRVFNIAFMPLRKS